MIPTAANPIGRDFGGSDELVIIVKPGILTADMTVTFTFQFNTTTGFGFIDWGDGTTSSTYGENSKTYASAGTYTIKIKGNNISRLKQKEGYNLVSWCNMNFASLSGISNLELPPGGNIGWKNLDVTKKAIVTFPTPFPAGSMYTRFSGAGKNSSGSSRIYVNEIPDSVQNMQQSFYESRLNVTLRSLPPGVTNLYSCFMRFTGSCLLDIDSIVANAPAGGFSALTNLGHMTLNATGISCTGSIAKFMHQCPNVTAVTASFQNVAINTFGTDDYFEVVMTTTAANQSWGFTPTSSAGTWYCFDWGDGTAVTSNKNLDVFTSGTRIAHTFAAPGTYHIKLAMNASEIAFDAYDSDNGKWELLGNPTH